MDHLHRLCRLANLANPNKSESLNQNPKRRHISDFFLGGGADAATGYRTFS